MICAKRCGESRTHMGLALIRLRINGVRLAGMIRGIIPAACIPLWRRRTVDIESLDVLLYDGRLHESSFGPSLSSLDVLTRERNHLRLPDQLPTAYGDEIRRTFPNIPRRVSGLQRRSAFCRRMDLTWLVPSLARKERPVTVLEATVQFIPSPKHRVLLSCWI